jgi:hypothetical protein
MRFLAFRYQRLLEHDLVHDYFDVSAVWMKINKQDREYSQ